MALDFSCKVSFVSHGTADPRFLDNLMGTRNQKENVESKMLFCPPDDSGPTHKRKKTKKIYKSRERETRSGSRPLGNAHAQDITSSLFIFSFSYQKHIANISTLLRCEIPK